MNILGYQTVSPGSWLHQIASLCLQYSLPHPASLLAAPLTRHSFKHLVKKKWDSLISQLNIPKRKTAMIYVKEPKGGHYHASLDKIVAIYNQLPATVKTKEIGPF